MTNWYIQNSMTALKELEMEKERIEEKIKNKQRMFKDYMIANNLEELKGSGEWKFYIRTSWGAASILLHLRKSTHIYKSFIV